MSNLFTCITCQIAFKESDSQRQHYKSDWHRYNLKRKVAELTAVTAEEFVIKVLAQRNESEESSKHKSKYCTSCRKNFNNENSFDNHLNSKKHKDNELHQVEADIENKVKEKSSASSKPIEIGENANDSNSEYEELDSDEWDEEFDVPTIDNICLFCTQKSRSIVRNLRHMSTAHSFFIPDAEFCIDVQGLINYLGKKVYQGFMCLWCSESGKSFHSAEAAQSHMKDKGHCKMLHEGAVLIEYSEFYDYSSSYPDVGNVENMDIDEEVDINVIDGTDFQLILPSGSVIGHRSLTRYYKQRLNPTSAVVAVPKSRKTLHRVLSQYRALGWTESKREQVIKKIRDIKYMDRVQRKWATNLSCKANKLQQHFRPQVNF